MGQASLQKTVQSSARKLGFHLSGIAPVDIARQSAENGQPGCGLPELAEFPEWVEAGNAGEMEYLKRRDEQGRFLRSDVRIPFPWARSVIVCAVNYNTDQPYSIDPLPPGTGESRGWIARYAWPGRTQTDAAQGERRNPSDYHTVIRERLEQLTVDLKLKLGEFQTRTFVDTGPLVERIYAKYAGIGWQGKNTCLINESLGSWVFLGVVLTSLDLPASQSVQPAPDRCGSCTRCIEACPTQALTPYMLEASRCIAYLTIEKRGPFPEEFAAKIGRNVFGCDICQEVCPWNNRGGKRPPVTDWPELQPRRELVNPAIEWLASLDVLDYRRLFKGSAIERAKYTDFARNVTNARQNLTPTVAQSVPASEKITDF